jgi:hypothetical protein
LKFGVVAIWDWVNYLNVLLSPSSGLESQYENFVGLKLI